MKRRRRFIQSCFGALWHGLPSAIDFSARMANVRKTLPLARKLARRSAALKALLDGS
jgi:hypothetical protein